MQSTITLEPIRHSEINEIGNLARAIWREHFVKIISAAQIEHMLVGRYTEADLAPYIGGADRWFDVLRVAGEASGFLRCLRTSADELKIEQIYLTKAQRGKGLGTLMLAHAEARARELGCRSMVLLVNRRNDDAIRAYRQSGFVVKEEQLVDIGNGFVMDDYLMQKTLSAISGGGDEMGE